MFSVHGDHKKVFHHFYYSKLRESQKTHKPRSSSSEQLVAGQQESKSHRLTLLQPLVSPCNLNQSGFLLTVVLHLSIIHKLPIKSCNNIATFICVYLCINTWAYFCYSLCRQLPQNYYRIILPQSLLLNSFLLDLDLPLCNPHLFSFLIHRLENKWWYYNF